MPETAIDWVAGAGPPWICANESVSGAAERVPGVTTRVTFTVAGLPPVNGVVDVNVMEPLYVPAERPAALAETVTVPGVAAAVLPLEGETVSQFPVPPVDTVAVQLIACPLLEIVIGCVAGAAPPVVCVKTAVLH